MDRADELEALAERVLMRRFYSIVAVVGILTVSGLFVMGFERMALGGCAVMFLSAAHRLDYELAALRALAAVERGK